MVPIAGKKISNHRLMKILLLNQVFYPDRVATAQHCFDLAQFLVREGHEVTVFTGKRDYEDRDKVYPGAEVCHGVRVYRLWSTGFGKRKLWGRIFDAASFFMALAFRLIRTPHHELVISFTSPPLIGVFGALFCANKGGCSLQWLMDVNPEAAFASGVLSPKSALGRFLQWLYRFSLNKSQRIVVLDRWMEKKVRPRLDKAQEVTILPPWSVLGAMPDLSQAKPNPFRQQQGLENQFVVLYSGNHSIVHPLDTLLETARLMKSDPQVTFLFIGKGIRTKDVSDFIARHSLLNCRQLPAQPRESLGHSLGSADLHVAVMGKELSGLVHLSKIYGILATGKPFVFIGPKDSHVGDLIRDCPNGYLVEHGNVAELQRVISEVKTLSQEKLSQIAEDNGQYLQKHFRPEVIFAHFKQKVLSPLSIDEKSRSDFLKKTAGF